jgi:hypothetical protein
VAPTAAIGVLEGRECGLLIAAREFLDRLVERSLVVACEETRV